VSTAKLRHDWEVLGREDPLWAVYVRADTRGSGWDVADFLRTGEAEVERSWRLLADPGRPEVVVDFGCGAGRTSRALAARADSVVGIDISAPMIDVAAQLCADRRNVSFVLSDSTRLPIRSGSVDLVYSSLVLQHLPRQLALGYVQEFLRVLRPDGVAVIQVATEPDHSVKGWLFRLMPAAVYGWAQVKLLRYPAPMRMQALRVAEIADTARQLGWSVRCVEADTTYGGHWRYARLVLRRERPGGARQPPSGAPRRLL
jgi:ubiquinone/menaquinone biosynthesis C-methylase UbiE